MLRITTVGANAVDYLVRGSGCAQHEHLLDATREPGLSTGPEAGVEHDSTDYYLSATAHGEAPGRWLGKGLGMLGVAEGAVVDEDTVRAVFGRLEDPETGEPLGRRIGNYKSYEDRLAAALAAEPEATPDRQREIADGVRAGGQRSVAYYDFTFSPVKSFSVQYAAYLAAGRHAEAAEMLRIQRDAVKIALDVAQEHAAYTRVGYHGRTKSGRSVGEYARVDGFTVSEWAHSTNREAEPQIHTHAAVLNRAVTTDDGKVRALDGSGFKPVKMAIASAYERAIEDLSNARLGFEWVTRPDGKAREIAGADLDLVKQASTRREQVEERVGELVEAYVDRHGREPSAAALKKMHQAATLETRKAKGPEAGPAAVKSWADRHHDALIKQLDSVEAAAATIAVEGHPDLRWMPDQSDREAILRRAVEDVQRTYPTWDIGNLTAAIDKQLLRVPGTAENRPKVLEAMAREAVTAGNKYGVLSLTPGDIVPVPDALCRKEDGRSKYRPHVDEKYVTEEHLSTERRIVAGAAQLTAPKIEGPELEVLRTEVEAIRIGDKPIGLDQVEAILGIASSGRAGDVLIGPAGAGKSTVVGVLSKTWTDRLGGRVLGLATSQRATQVLAEEGMEAINTTQFLSRFGPDENGDVRDRIRPGDMIVVDEAGMSATRELAQISKLVEDGGGKLLYTGDHQQLGSIGAGGMLNLLATDNGKYELEDVHRFRDQKDPSRKASPWEGAASLRLREGDKAVVSEYDERGRLRGGTVDQMQGEAMRAYLADTVAGLDSLLIVGSNDEAAQLSQSIREELISLGRVSEESIARLKDDTRLSVGDVIQARRNDWSIQVDGPGMITNRLTYTVVGRDERGRLLVEDQQGVQAHLPDSYVREHVTLAYASTVHAAQGRTVDTSHAMLSEQSLREDAYVALTRGKSRNTAYLTTARQPDSHEQGLDVTPAEQMAAVLDRSGAATAAELQYREVQEEGRSLSWIGTQWDLVSKEYSRDRYTDVLADVLGEDKVDGLLGEEAYPSLVRSIRSAELAGHNAENLLRETIAQRELDTADSVSAVLRHRLNAQIGGRAPEQRVDARDWTTFQAPLSGPVGEFMQGLAVASSDRQAALAAQVAADMPEWAQHHLGDAPEEPEQRREWLHRAGVAAAYRELQAIPDDQLSLGAAPSPENEFHRALWKNAHRALGNPADALDYQGATEAELREMRATWQREQAWAPAWVADELKAANERAQDYRQDAVLFRAHLDGMDPDSSEYARTLAEVERAERQAADYAEIAYQVDEVHRARQAWYAATEPARVADQLAAEELERRNLPLQPETTPQPQQTELFSVIADAEVGPAPERDEAEFAPRAWELDPANQPEAGAEPVEHVRWWQRWADDLRTTMARQEAEMVDSGQVPLFALDPVAATEAYRRTLAEDQTVVEQAEDQAVEVDPAQTMLFDVESTKPIEVTRTWDYVPPVAEQTTTVEQDQAADVEQATRTATPTLVDEREVDHAPVLAADDENQLDLFVAEPTVEDRVLQQPLRAASQPEPELDAEPVATLEDRTTIVEALRSARAAEAQALRRQAAEAVRESRRDKAAADERVAQQEAAERASRDRRDLEKTKTSPNVDRDADKTRERRTDEPVRELVPTTNEDLKRGARQVAQRLREQQDRDFQQRQRSYDSGPHHGHGRGPGLGM